MLAILAATTGSEMTGSETFALVMLVAIVGVVAAVLVATRVRQDRRDREEIDQIVEAVESRGTIMEVGCVRCGKAFFIPTGTTPLRCPLCPEEGGSDADQG